MYSVLQKKERLLMRLLPLRETERVNKYGFTASEYERARVNVLKNYESNYKERDKQKNGTYSKQICSHFTDGGKSISGIENEYAMINQIAPSVTLEQVNQYIQDIIGEKNVVISVSSQKKKDLYIPRKKNCWMYLIKHVRRN